MRLFCLLISLLFVGLMPAKAEEIPEISVKAEVDHAFITIGDPVEYTVRIRHHPDVQILSTIPTPPRDVFKIKKVKDIRDENEDYVTTGKVFSLTAFRLGEYVLEPIEIEYRKSRGEVQSISTEKIYLRVKSVAEGEEKTDIRGIKGVIAIPKGSMLLLIILGVAGLAILAMILFGILRKKSGDAVETKPALSPEEEAFFRLNKLYDSDLIRREKYKEYYFILSEILRVYFERRFHIQAVESTTFEIARSLKEKDVDHQLREKINEVLEAADLAKFAKWRPDPQKIILYNQKSKEIVEEAKPQVRAVEAENGV